MKTPRRRQAFRLATLAAATLAIACQAPEAPEPAASARPVALPRPNVYLISIDTLRADRLPAYGYQAGRTPAIDALREDAILFSRAYSHTPLTLPSHATLLTGLLPTEHRVHDNAGFRLDPEFETLPERLREAGYRTGAAVSSYVLGHQGGLDQGFEQYEADFQWSPGTGLGEVQRAGSDTLGLLRPWLRERAAEGGPHFALLHLYEPHSPYQPATSGFTDPYDGEVTVADDVVGDFLDELRALGLYEDALILLLSDHGEGLGDHGEQEHGLLLTPEVLHVPLLIKRPGGVGAGTRRNDPVGLVDVTPTVLDLLGLADAPSGPTAGGTTGRALFGTEPPGPLIAETVYPRLHFGWSELVSVLDDSMLYVHGPTPELFDLADDPTARTNLLDSRRREAHRLRGWVLEYGLDPAEVAPTSNSTEDQAALAALGYASSGTGALVDGLLPDPRTRIHTLEDLTAGFDQFHAGDWPGAALSFERAVAANPGLIHAWEHLGRARQNAGQLDAALAAYREALELWRRSAAPAPPTVLPPAAMILLRARRGNEALALVREGLAATPGDRRLRDLEIRILLTLDQIEPALRLAGALAAEKPRDPAASYQHGVALLLAGERERGEAELRRTLSLQPGHPAAQADLARLTTSDRP